jgi:SAM-dependent methyltransferase
VAPYSGLAFTYDRLVGEALAPSIRKSFEHALMYCGVTFRSAADIGCGTGSFLSYLLRFGVPLWGVDASPFMLRIAARRLPAPRVRLLRQDIRRLCLPKPVDLITCNGDTLNYLLTREDLACVLGRCRANLTPRGHLVGDLLTGLPPAAEEGWRLVVSAPGAITMSRSRVDRSRRLTRVDLRYRQPRPEGWRWVQETHVQRWYSIPEVHLVLREAGLGLRALWRLDGGGGPNGVAWTKLLARRLPSDAGPA